MLEFRTPTGRYSGELDEDVVRVRGIRYATAERFTAPRPVEPHAGVLPAIERAPACPQPPSRGDRLLGDPYRGIRFDEDCLRLSVTIPAGAEPGDGLPVLVWIHGGSYVAGGGDLPIFDPAALVREQRVVVVAVTFRLGVLGFLGDGVRVPANLGLLDLLEALRWIHAGVRGFGGDPGDITLFGQSAGADAIAHLLISDGAAGLFRRVILQSAPFGIRRNRGAMTRRMLAAVGVLGSDADTARLFAAHDRAYAAARRYGLRSGMPFGPQYGQAPLPPETQVEAAWRAAAHRVDVLVGWTADETSFFGALSPGLTRLFRLPAVGPLLRAALIRGTTDAVYRRGGRAFARLVGRAGGRVVEYELDWRPRGGPAGAGHTTDLPLLFPDAKAWAGARLLGDTDPGDLERLGAPVRAVWAAFARGDELRPVLTDSVRLTLRGPVARSRRSEYGDVMPPLIRRRTGVRIAVQADSSLPPARVQELIASIDLPAVFHRWGPFPAVTAVEGQTGPWDRPGRSRRIHFSDGGSAVETLVEYTAAAGFAYELLGFTDVFGRMVDGVRGEWTFTPDGTGSRVRWSWTLMPRGAARPLLAGVVAPLVRRPMQRVIDASVTLAEQQAAAGDVWNDVPDGAPAEGSAGAGGPSTAAG